MAKNGKIPKSKPIDSDREARVLLENMDRNITRIAEAQSSTTAQIVEIKSAIAGLATKSEVNTISMAVIQISSDVKNIDMRLKTVEEKLDKDLDNHDKRITKLEEKVLV